MSTEQRRSRGLQSHEPGERLPPVLPKERGSDFDTAPTSVLKFDAIHTSVFNPETLDTLAAAHDISPEQVRELFAEQFERVARRTLYPWKALGIDALIKDGELLLQPKHHTAKEILDRVAETISQSLIEESVAALRRTEVQIALESAAHTDSLTGLSNRAGLESALTTFEQRPPEAIHTLLFFHIDLDHFKKINDTYGHAAGDAVLRETAHTLRNTVRANDITIRLGGEELGVLMFNVDEAHIDTIAEHIRTAIGEQTIVSPEVDGQPIQITASIGVAHVSDIPKTQSLHETTKQLIHDADIATFRAKALGRNRVERAKTEEVLPKEPEELFAFEQRIHVALSYDRVYESLDPDGRILLDMELQVRVLREYRQYLQTFRELIQASSLSAVEKKDRMDTLEYALFELQAKEVAYKQQVQRWATSKTYGQ